MAIDATTREESPQGIDERLAQKIGQMTDGQTMGLHMTGHRLQRKTLRQRLIVVVACSFAWSVTGCTQVPELDATIPTHLNTAAYPKLVRLDGSLTTAITPQAQSAEIESALAARAKRLQARARSLQSPVVDSATRKRMQNEIDG